jgi:hypothetical protein
MPQDPARYTLRLSIRASAFSESEKASPPALARVRRSGNSHHPLCYIFDWSSLSKYSSASLHCSSLHSLSWQVTDFWRRLTWASRFRSLVICHNLYHLTHLQVILDSTRELGSVPREQTETDRQSHEYNRPHLYIPPRGIKFSWLISPKASREKISATATRTFHHPSLAWRTTSDPLRESHAFFCNWVSYCPERWWGIAQLSQRSAENPWGLQLCVWHSTGFQHKLHLLSPGLIRTKQIITGSETTACSSPSLQVCDTVMS